MTTAPLMLPADTTATGSLPPIPSIALDVMLNRRDAAVAHLRIIAEHVNAFCEMGDALFKDPESGGVHARGGYDFYNPIGQRCNNGHVADLNTNDWLPSSIRAVDAALWDYLLAQSGLWSFFDSKAREDWRKQIDERKTPALTADNIRATFEGLHAQRGIFFERGVIALFRFLSWEYKTNKPIAFGKRIVCTSVLDSYGFTNSGVCDKLDDLDRAFHILDGKPEPDHRSSIQSRLREQGRAVYAPLETPYFKIKLFQNGNGHVKFLRADLVDKLNLILAKYHPDALARSARPDADGGD